MENLKNEFQKEKEKSVQDAIDQVKNDEAIASEKCARAYEDLIQTYLKELKSKTKIETELNNRVALLLKENQQKHYLLVETKHEFQRFYEKHVGLNKDDAAFLFANKFDI